jgi:hypothetical protein
MNPEILFDIAPNVNQRFIHMTDEAGRDYLVSLPKEKAEFHTDILIYAGNHFGKKLIPHGGGKIKISDGAIYLSGKSNVFGDFNKEKVTEILKKAYPKSNIVLE